VEKLQIEIIYLVLSILIEKKEYLKPQAKEKLKEMAKYYNVSFPRVFTPTILNINTLIDFCNIEKSKQNTIVNLYKTL